MKYKEKILADIKERIKNYKLWDGRRNRLVRIKDIKQILATLPSEKEIAEEVVLDYISMFDCDSDCAYTPEDILDWLNKEEP